MEHPKERYYKLNRFLISVGGLSPEQSVWNTYLMRAFLTVMLLSSTLFQSASVFTNEFTLELIVDVIPAVLPVFGGVVHLYARIMNVGKYKKLFDHMWSDWAMQKTKEEGKIMHDYANMTRIITFIYTLQTYSFLVGYHLWMFVPEVLDAISPLNESRPRIKTFSVNYFIDEDRYLYVIRFHIFIVIIASAIVFLCNFSILITFALHACGMCKLLGYRAERLFCVIENVAECDFIRGKEISYGNSAVFVRLHYNVIQFINKIEACHTGPFLLDLGGILLALSTTMIQMLTIGGNIERAFRSIAFAILMLIYAFITNYIGQIVTDMSSSICEKIYNSAWYNAPVSEQKSVLVIMNRRFHPLVLTANKFYIMCLQNFGMMLQTAVSYCMFIRQV